MAWRNVHVGLLVPKERAGPALRPVRHEWRTGADVFGVPAVGAVHRHEWEGWLGWLEMAVHLRLHHGCTYSYLWLRKVRRSQLLSTATDDEQIFFPDTPETTTAFYLNDWERARARERIREEGREPVGSWNWGVIARIFGSWQVYAFTLAYSLWMLTAGLYVMQYYGLYLKATGMYSVPQIDNIPTSMGAVNFVFMISSGFVADKIGRRGPVCFAVGCLLTFVYAVLTAWYVPHALRLAVFTLAGCYGCYTPLLAGWTNEACGGDQQKRAFVLAFMVSVGSAVVIPFQQLQFPSSQAPEFSKTHGWASALVFVVALTLWTGIGLPMLQKWRESKARPFAEQYAGGVDA